MCGDLGGHFAGPTSFQGRSRPHGIQAPLPSIQPRLACPLAPASLRQRQGQQRGEQGRASPACSQAVSVRCLPTLTPREVLRGKSAPWWRKRGSKEGRELRKRSSRVEGEKKKEKKRNTTHAGEARGSMQICSLQTANHWSWDAMQRTSLCNEGGWSSFPQKSSCFASHAFSTHRKDTCMAMRGTPKKQLSLLCQVIPPSELQWQMAPFLYPHGLDVTSVLRALKRERIRLFLLDQTCSARCSNPIY